MKKKLALQTVMLIVLGCVSLWGFQTATNIEYMTGHRAGITPAYLGWVVMIAAQMSIWTIWNQIIDGTPV